MSTLAPTLQAFFTDRLIRQRHASSHTIAAYRDTFKLLLAFAGQRTGTAGSDLRITDLDAPLIGAFLDHLETGRGNGVRTRNARLAAVHSLFRYAALRHPEDSAVIQRVLAIPPKRFDRTIITYLTETEIDALLAAPDQSTWTGRRDHALLATAIQTGLRASELTSLSVNDAHLGAGAHVSCLEKGRKQRITPLTGSTVTVLKNWMTERAGLPADPLFPTRTGARLSRDALERRIAKHAATAALSCPTLAEKKISPHVMRHTYAMRLLNAGVDTTVIALWLGHAAVATTMGYYQVSLKRKQQAIRSVGPLATDAAGNATPFASPTAYERASVAVPFGNCTEPSNVKAGGGACPIRFQCAGCGFYRPDPSYLPALEQHIAGLRTDRETAQAMEAAHYVQASLTAEIDAFTTVAEAMRRKLSELDPAQRAEVEGASRILRRARAARTLPLTDITARATETA